MHLLDKIPQVSFPSAYPAGYSAAHSTGSPNFVPPSHWDIQANRRMNDQFVSLKSRLSSLLRTGQLANLPMAFPFYCVPTGNGDFTITRSSYEFIEYIAMGHTSRPSCVVFSYTAPCYERKGGPSLPSTNMTWRIKAPSRESSRQGESLTNFETVAQVEVDPSILETAFALDFMTNPRMLLSLLSLSLEQGLHVFMEIAVPSLAVSYPQRSGVPYRKGDLVIAVKRNDGQREVIHVYAP